MAKNITSLGLDLSLVGSGLVILKNGKITKQRLIKSKPVPDGRPIDELKRIKKIVEEVESIIAEDKIIIGS